MTQKYLIPSLGKLFCFFAFFFFAPPIYGNTPLNKKILEHFCPRDFDLLHISDWKNPSLEDFSRIEDYLIDRRLRIILEKKEKNMLSSTCYGEISYRIGRTCLYNGEQPKFVKVDFGNDPNQKELCIISYAGYPHPRAKERDYEQGIKTIIKALERLRFKGHFIYRIGGWPAPSEGRLRYADVPYAFKPFLFEEVKNLGYKHILWLDSACVPVKKLDAIFTQIKQQGVCYHYEGNLLNNTLRNWDFIRVASKCPKKGRYLNAITQVVGLSMVHPVGMALLNDWIQAACERLPFLSPTADQLCFAFLVSKHNAQRGKLRWGTICSSHSKTHRIPVHGKGSAIIHNYFFLDPRYKASEPFFAQIR